MFLPSFVSVILVLVSKHKRCFLSMPITEPHSHLSTHLENGLNTYSITPCSCQPRVPVSSVRRWLTTLLKSRFFTEPQPGVIASLPAVEGLRADAIVVTGKSGILTTEVVVVKPFESLPGFLR